MATDSLVQIALIISIVALLLFILVLIRSYFVLADMNEMSGLLNKRLKDIDNWCSDTTKSVKGIMDMIKTIIASFNQFKSVGEKLTKTFQKEKGEE